MIHRRFPSRAAGRTNGARLLQFGEQFRRYAMVDALQQIEQFLRTGLGGFVLRGDTGVALLQLGQEALAVGRIAVLLLQRVMRIDQLLLFVGGGRFDHEVLGQIAKQIIDKFL